MINILKIWPCIVFAQNGIFCKENLPLITLLKQRNTVFFQYKTLVNWFKHRCFDGLHLENAHFWILTRPQLLVHTVTYVNNYVI
jgi:hypothetical protein